MPAKAKITKPSRVQKIINSPILSEPEKAEIAVEGADHLYREIENAFENEKGQRVKLNQGAAVEVTVEAEANATNRKHA